MGLFGFVGDIVGAAVKTVVIPIAVAKDAVNVITGEDVDATKKIVESVGEDLSDAVDKVLP